MKLDVTGRVRARVGLATLPAHDLTIMNIFTGYGEQASQDKALTARARGGGGVFIFCMSKVLDYLPHILGRTELCSDKSDF